MGVIKRSSSTELIIDYVLEKIRAREWKPGDQLMNERTFSEELGVSRMPLREAFSALSLMGILDAQQGSGTYIKQYDPEALGRLMTIYSVLDDISLDDLFEVRAVLESQMARLATMRCTPENLRKMEESLAEGRAFLEKCKNAPSSKEATMQKFFQLNSFHNAIAAAAQNRYLLQLMDAFRMMSAQFFERSSGDPLQNVMTAIEEHTAVFEAIRDQRADEAAARMYAHLIHEAQGLKNAM